DAARQRRGRGSLQLPVYRRRAGVRGDRHALPATADGHGRSRRIAIGGPRMTTTTTPERSYGRAPDGLRPTTIELHFVKPAAGSALITQGETRVICTASVQDSVPRWMA